MSIFLTSSGIDLVRKGGHDLTQVAPLASMKDMIDEFQSRGGVVWACPPCVRSRGYAADDLLEGVTIIGASAVHHEIAAGAATLSF